MTSLELSQRVCELGVEPQIDLLPLVRHLDLSMVHARGRRMEEREGRPYQSHSSPSPAVCGASAIAAHAACWRSGRRLGAPWLACRATWRCIFMARGQLQLRGVRVPIRNALTRTRGDLRLIVSVPAPERVVSARESPPVSGDACDWKASPRDPGREGSASRPR